MTTLLSSAPLAAMLTLLTLSAPCQAAEIRGFRGIAWGDSAARLGPVQQVSKTAGVTCYERASESLVFGDSVIEGVRFCFRQDRLFMVAIASRAPPERIRAEFQSTYGPPDKRSPGSMSWLARSSPSRAELVYAKGQPTVLSIYSVKET